MDSQALIDLKMHLGQTDAQYATGGLNEKDAGEWRAWGRQYVIRQICEMDPSFVAMPLAFYLSASANGQAWSHLKGGRMHCGLCNQPEGQGDWIDPSLNGLSGCHTPGCPRNPEIEED